MGALLVGDNEFFVSSVISAGQADGEAADGFRVA